MAKHSKVDKSLTLPASSPRRQSPKAAQSVTPKTTNITSIAGGSLPLKKSAEMAIEIHFLTSNVDGNRQKNNSNFDRGSKVTPKTPRDSAVPASNNHSDRAVKRLGKDFLEKTSNNAGISTRHSARKERQSKMIMTRKRLSLENPPTSSSGSSIKSLSPARVPANAAATKWFKLKAPSKIPVRRGRPHKVDRSAISDTTTPSSEAESVSIKAHLSPLRRKENSAKVPAGKLGTSSSALPVPVRLTRIKHSQAINKQKSPKKKHKDRQHI